MKLKEKENLNYMELIQGRTLAVPGPPANLSLLLGDWEISVFAQKSHTGFLDFTGSEHRATLEFFLKHSLVICKFSNKIKTFLTTS